jgi:hypothetical protein
LVVWRVDWKAALLVGWKVVELVDEWVVLMAV